MPPYRVGAPLTVLPLPLANPMSADPEGQLPPSPPYIGGDRARLEAWCERHYAEVQARVHQLLAQDVRRGRPWLAAMLSTGDIVHEVFLGVVRDFAGFRGHSEGEFVAYLARLVRNRLIDTVRHHEAARRDRRRVADELPDVPASERSPGSKLGGRDDAEQLAAILQTLPERDRSLLRGRLEDEQPFQDLAEALSYASADSPRKAFCAVQARVLAKLQLAQRRQA